MLKPLNAIYTQKLKEVYLMLKPLNAIYTKAGCCGILNMAEDVIKKVKMFRYLGNALCTEDEVQKTETARIIAGWKRFKDVAKVLCYVTYNNLLCNVQ